MLPALPSLLSLLSLRPAPPAFLALPPSLPFSFSSPLPISPASLPLSLSPAFLPRPFLLSPPHPLGNRRPGSLFRGESPADDASCDPWCNSRRRIHGAYCRQVAPGARCLQQVAGSARKRALEGRTACKFSHITAFPCASGHINTRACTRGPITTKTANESQDGGKGGGKGGEQDGIGQGARAGSKSREQGRGAERKRAGGGAGGKGGEQDGVGRGARAGSKGGGAERKRAGGRQRSSVRQR